MISCFGSRQTGKPEPRCDCRPVRMLATVVASATLAVGLSSTAEPPAERGAEITIRGRVLLPGGKPPGGAHLAVIAQRTAIGRGGDELDWGHEVLGDATADDNGAYALRLTGVSQQTHHYASLIARRDGYAVAWRKINLDAAETKADFELKPEEPLRGKLIDVEGRPAAEVRVSIGSVSEVVKDAAEPSGTGYRPSDKVPPAWIAPVRSDDAGKFVLHGLAANQGVTLQVKGDDRFAQQDIALNTGMPEERGERDGTYRPLVKNVNRGEEALLALAPAKIFAGTVRYADGGAAVPHARLTIYAGDEEHGSFIGMPGVTDEQGRYRIIPWAGSYFGLLAHSPRGTAYMGRNTPPSGRVRWEGGERLKEIDLTLPRGVLVRGTVVEAGSGSPVAGAAVQYMPESSNNPNDSDDILTGWQCIEVTDGEGRFTMAVLPGPGRLLVNGPHGKYVFQELGGREIDSGKPGGTRNYVHAFVKVNPEKEQDPIDVKLTLQPGATVKGRIVDEQGGTVDEALVVSRLNISPYSLHWRGHTIPTLGGRFELSGLAAGVEYTIYFLDSKRKLGATEIIKAGDKERTVVLKPCGAATFRLIDEKGEPMPANYGWTEMVVTPGASKFDRAAIDRGELLADSDFIINIDRANHPYPDNDDGRRSLTALVPGATYRVVGKRGGQIVAVKEFKVRAGETADLGEIKVERE